MKRMLTLAALAVLCTGLTATANAKDAPAAAEAAAETGVKAPRDAASGQASGKRAAAKPGKPGKNAGEATPVLPPGATPSAGKYYYVSNGWGKMCCRECTEWNGNTCKSWTQCAEGSTGAGNCNKQNHE